jgi:outer membrane protein TolC
MIKKIGFILLIFSQLKGFSQDTLKTLSAENLLSIVKSFHPIVQKTNINNEKAKAEILFARGAFDPIFSKYTSKKTFDGNQYYQINTNEIRIPTWFGIEVLAGTENIAGDRFDIAETNGKTSYFGLNISLAKNLVLDKRRAALAQAKIYSNLTKTEQASIINNLLMDATESYWNWVLAYEVYEIISSNVTINKQRLLYTTKSFYNGERAAIDTLEAFTQLQSFEYQQVKQWLIFQKAGIDLSQYLWKADNTAYNLPENIFPNSILKNNFNGEEINLDLLFLQNKAIENHPDLQFYDYKQQILEIDKKLKFQELLPKVDFRYNQLGKGYQIAETATRLPLFENNYQYGLKIEMPLRLSAGRSEYQTAKLKIKETNLNFAQKKQEITLKIQKYFSEYQSLKAQIKIQTENTENYKKLVSAEEKKLFNGESSLFLVNSREIKTQEAQQKLIELKIDYQISINKLLWSAGMLN